MKDPEQPAESADPMPALFEAFSPGTPLADNVESLLATGPVPIDEAQLQASADRLMARLSPSEQPPVAPERSANSPWVRPLIVGGLAIAVAASIAVILGLQSPPAPAPDPLPPQVAMAPPPTPSPAASSEALELSPKAVASIQGDTLLLASGQAAFRRDGTLKPSVRTITLESAGWVLRPIGTVFVTGVEGPYSAVTVRSGTVIVQEQGRDIAELTSGQWIVTGPEGQLRFSDGQQPTLDEASLDLVRQLRWLGLPLKTRTALQSSPYDE